MSNMFNLLSEVNRELINKILNINTIKAIIIKVSNEPNLEAHDNYHDIRFISLNAIIDTLIKISNNDDEVKIDKIS